MCLRLVPKSVTLNDLERRNGRVVCVISPNLVGLGAYYVTVVEDRPILSRVECSPKNLVFSGISLMVIITPGEGVKVKRPFVASENLTSWKRCKIGGKLVLIKNLKSHMGFQLVILL